MDAINEIKMEIEDFGCDFCSKSFLTRLHRKVHTFTHFITRSCSGCNFQLVKIADDWYVSHDDMQCIDKTKNENKIADTELGILNYQTNTEETTTFEVEYDNDEADGLDDSNLDDCSSNGQWESVYLPQNKDDKSRSEIEPIELNENNGAGVDKSTSEPSEMQAKIVISHTKRELNDAEAKKPPSLKKVKCDICERWLSNRATLKAHMRYHMDLKPFKCEFCDRGFREKYKLRDHLYTHGGDKPYKCDQCESSFTYERGLRAHKTNVHEKLKKFKCSICERALATQGGLNVHMKSHLDAKPFICEVCGRGFNAKNPLREHLNMHEGKKPYSCKYCSKTFARKSRVSAHIRIHTGAKPFKCPIDQCERAYAYDIDLKRHKYSVHGIYHKKYPCSICGKIYSENKLLKKHMDSHTKIDLK